MYSGVSGLQMKAEIFMGVVYYQRLRHMVNDKAQARSLGPIDVLTRQPVKGRKNQGGIRFGEMERDSLLAHGVSFCLHDRLFNCSDYSEGKFFSNFFQNFFRIYLCKMWRIISGFKL
jgi:DNA-directed RNA polymerase I subunit RPA2